MNKRFQTFIDKQKSRKKSALISDAVFILLIIVLIIPSSRMWLKQKVSEITMTSPNANREFVALSQAEKNLQLVDEEGKPVTLEDFSGEVVFLNYWATWCPPCRAEMPAIQSLYNEYQDKMVFLFVTNEPLETVHAYFDANNYQLPVHRYASEPQGNLASQSIPTTFIITKKGEIALKKNGAAQWDSDETKNFLDELLGKKI